MIASILLFMFIVSTIRGQEDATISRDDEGNILISTSQSDQSIFFNDIDWRSLVNSHQLLLNEICGVDDNIKSILSIATEGMVGQIHDISFDPDGTAVAIARADAVKVWYHRGTWEPADKLMKHVPGQHIYSIDIQNLSGINRMASGCQDGSIFIWEYTQSLKLESLPTNSVSPIKVVKFSPDGKYLVAGNEDGDIMAYDAIDDYKTISLQNDGHASQVNDVAFTNTGLFASASGDMKVLIWNMTTWQVVHSLNFNIPVESASFSPDNELLVLSSSQSNTITILDTSSWNETVSITAPNKIKTVRFNPIGRFIAAVSEVPSILMYRIQDWTLMKEQTTPHEDEELVGVLEFYPDGTIFGTDGVDDDLILWRTACFHEYRT